MENVEERETEVKGKRVKFKIQSEKWIALLQNSHAKFCHWFLNFRFSNFGELNFILIVKVIWVNTGFVARLWFDSHLKDGIVNSFCNGKRKYNHVKIVNSLLRLF